MISSQMQHTVAILIQAQHVIQAAAVGYSIINDTPLVVETNQIMCE